MLNMTQRKPRHPLSNSSQLGLIIHFSSLHYTSVSFSGKGKLALILSMIVIILLWTTKCQTTECKFADKILHSLLSPNSFLVLCCAEDSAPWPMFSHNPRSQQAKKTGRQTGLIQHSLATDAGAGTEE